jgi:predicted lipoprotein
MAKQSSSGPWVKRGIIAVAVVALLAAMYLNTTFVSGDQLEEYVGKQFSAEEFAQENYESVIVPAIMEKAVPATELYEAVVADVDASGEKYGGRAGTSAWAFPVTFTGVAGDANKVNGQMQMQIEGLPEDLQVLVQMGPPVIGSALRDVTGEYQFGDFLNQTEFQNAGQSLNDMVRQGLLQEFKAADLKGKTIEVYGAFLGDNAKKKWLVTPVQITVVG